MFHVEHSRSHGLGAQYQEQAQPGQIYSGVLDPMLRGYRAIVAALGLVLAAHHPNAEAQPKQSNPQERSASALENIASRYDDQAERSEGSREAEKCEQGDDKRYSDLCAQWKAADAAADSAWWAAIAGFATAISTILVLIALWLAFRSNSIARGAAHGQLRAYVTVGDVDIRRQTEKGSARQWSVDVVLENNGQTPAFVRHFEIKMGWEKKGIAADIIEEVFFKERDIQVVIASGKPFAIRVEIEQDHFSPAALHDGDILIVFGKFDYLDIFERPRKTNFRMYADHDCWTKGAGVVAVQTSMTGNKCT